MNKKILPASLVLLLASACFAPPAAADTKSQLIQIETQLQIMQDNMTQMKQSFDERMGVMKDLITQQTDNVNKMGAAIQNLQKTLGSQSTDNSSKIDQISGQVQSLHDAVDELKARLAKVSTQLDAIQSAQQNIGNPSAQPAAASPDAASQAPPPDALYRAAYGDFNAGKDDVATQEFTQYLQAYGNTDLAGNAQFYLGEILYRQGNYQQAILAYDKVLDQYPGGNKAAAAQLKKGYSLLAAGDRTAAVRELRSLINRYPQSPEAAQARERLSKLGVAGAASRPPRPSPRHH